MARLDISFYSYTLHHGVSIAVTIPTFTPCDHKPDEVPTHAPAEKFPVLYLLHGHGNDHLCWTRYTSAERLAEEQRIAIVTFNTQNKAYNNCPNGDLYYDFLNTELHDFITNMFPISARPEDTYIAGLSMGGYGTLAHALTNPGRYCAFGAMSPGVSGHRLGQAMGDPGLRVIEPIEELKKRLDEGTPLPKGYICCGTSDFLYDRVAGFVEDARTLGADFTWHPVDGYEHEWRYWDYELANFLRWIPRTDYYADKPHKV